MYDDIEGIKTAVHAFQSTMVYTALKLKWQDDFNLYRLNPYDAGKGYYSYTSNAPRLLADKSISMLVQAHLIVRVPIETLTAEERRIAGNCERFAYGALNLADALLATKRMPSIREQMAWYATVRGGFAGRAYLTKRDGETIPDVAIWDVYNVAYGDDWICHVRKATKEQIKVEYDIDIIGIDAAVYDYWDTEKNGVIIGDVWGRPLKSHGLKYNPAFIKAVGAMPTVWQADDQNINVERFQSVLSANRYLYPILNKTISDLLTIVRRGVKPPIGIWSPTGQEGFDEDIWQVEKGSIVKLSSGTEIKPILEMTMPSDAYQLLQIISGEEQRGGFSHISYGQVATRLSGYAINQLQAAMDTIVAPFTETMRQSYEEIINSLVGQYTAGFKPIKVRGRTSRNEAFGYPEGYQIKHSDIRKDWKPEVRLEPVLPRDDAQRVLMAMQLRQEDSRGVPLISDETLQDVYVGVKDPDLEKEKVTRQLADMTPLIRLQASYDAYMADGQYQKAQYVTVEMQRLILDMQGRLAAAQGSRAGQLGGLGQEAMGLPGAGIPPTETGYPPEVMPSEALGGLPGGAMQAAPAGGEV